MPKDHGSTRFQAPRGTKDVLPEDAPYWSFVRRTGERIAQLFGYGYIETPMFEDARLFLRGAGEGTDIAEKEIYIFKDRGNDRLALRPEGTANVCRAYLEHGMQTLPQPIRLYYVSPVFRYDRPQAGRFRQHTQFGVEAIGDGSALIDAEVIDLLASFYDALGLAGLSLQLNSIGDPTCRPAYIEALRSYYANHLSDVCDDCRVRYEKNPMRLLDCKEERCQAIAADAPLINDHLCAACEEQFAALQSYLKALDIGFELNPRLVRGLDYYTRTVFEFQPPEEGSQSTIGAGGRYDGLIELLGGKATPGTGFGTGFERIILNLKRQDVPVPEAGGTRVYVAHASEAAQGAAIGLARELRQAGVTTVIGGSGRSLKAQLRHAGGLDAKFAAIIGDKELAQNEVTLRDMAGGEQRQVPRSDVLQSVED